jgi:uncharacterized protein YegL
MSGDISRRVELAQNPEPRCPVALVVDTSGSMDGQPIRELNQGLAEFKSAVQSDHLAALRVEVALITFGGRVTLAQPFATVDRFDVPTLVADGDTPMGQAVRLALETIRQRKQEYKQFGIDYYRPWLLLISDGEPTDSGWEHAADEACREEDRKGVSIFPIGVEGANLSKLARFSKVRQPLKLKGLAFKELFLWLSKSITIVSQSRLGEDVNLPPPSGWAQITT